MRIKFCFICLIYTIESRKRFFLCFLLCFNPSPSFRQCKKTALQTAASRIHYMCSSYHSATCNSIDLAFKWNTHVYCHFLTGPNDWLHPRIIVSRFQSPPPPTALCSFFKPFVLCHFDEKKLYNTAKASRSAYWDMFIRPSVCLFVRTSGDPINWYNFGTTAKLSHSAMWHLEHVA